MSVQTLDEVPGDIYVLQFDGGVHANLGVGGYLVWEPGGKLLKAQALWFGEEKSTNNEAEVGALLEGMRWVIDQGFSQGAWMVLGDSNLVLGFCTRRYKPQ